LLNILPQVGITQLGGALPAALPGVGLFLSRNRPVTVAAPISAKFAGNRAFGSAEPLCNVRQAAIAASHPGYNLTVFQGKMMGHRGDSVRKGCLLNKTTQSNIPAMFLPIPVFHSLAFQF
jgi:hypothetical protein